MDGISLLKYEENSAGESSDRKESQVLCALLPEDHNDGKSSGLDEDSDWDSESRQGSEEDGRDDVGIVKKSAIWKELWPTEDQIQAARERTRTIRNRMAQADNPLEEGRQALFALIKEHQKTGNGGSFEGRRIPACLCDLPDE